MRKATIADYDWLYEHTKYGNFFHRDRVFMDWILENIPKASIILDISCGRGNLIRKLIAHEYACIGTEVSDYLLQNTLKALDVRKLRCDELHKVPDSFVHAVVCNDVLEHLEDEEAAESALKEICRITRKWVLLSIGIYDDWWKVDGKPVKLHNIVENTGWWSKLFHKYCTIEFAHVEHVSFFLFGVPHDKSTF